jgi:hypothetical protein
MMEPIAFDGAEFELGDADGPFGLLPTYTDGEQCLTCWRMGFIDRIRALIFGRVWVGVLSGTTQPPIWLDCRQTVFEKAE